jgi:hypothetical protein
VVDRGEPVHRQVEQLHLHAGLADVDADDVAEPRVDPQQHARAAAVGLDQTGLDDEPLLDELTGHVGDRRRAQPGELAQLVPAQRTVEEQFGQQGGPVVPAQVPDCGALPRHDFPSPVTRRETACLTRLNTRHKLNIQLSPRVAGGHAWHNPGRAQARPADNA